ncbi:hypothetical protein H6792_02615 [Candidatus Nomurabacteria bacterium]|nr:hypothetical protein [Candidatus Nomurabacteria bacterium]
MIQVFNQAKLDFSQLLNRPTRKQNRQSIALVASDLIAISQVEPLYRTIADNYQFYLENKPDLSLPISDLEYLSSQPRGFNQIVYGLGSSFSDKLRSNIAPSIEINPTASLSLVNQASKWLKPDDTNFANLDTRLIINIHHFYKLIRNFGIALPKDNNNLVLLESSLIELQSKLSLSSISLILRDKLWIYFSPTDNLIINFTIPSSLMLDLIQATIISFQQPDDPASLDLIGSILTQTQSSQLELSLAKLKRILSS